MLSKIGVFTVSNICFNLLDILTTVICQLFTVETSFNDLFYLRSFFLYSGYDICGNVMCS